MCSFQHFQRLGRDLWQRHVLSSAGVFMQAEAETSPVSAALRGRGLEHPATVAQINANNL
jgi:hypothetical protein